MQIEVVSKELIRVHGLTVDYDQTPAEAIKGLPENNPLIATCPQKLWNGRKTGKVEEVTISLFFPGRYFSTAEGRDLQKKIGFGCPAELAALKGEDVRKELWDQGIWVIVSLMENDEALWLDSAGRRPVWLRLDPGCHGFGLGCAVGGWDGRYVLVGAPQVP